jgi:hypothetical protein
MLKHRLHAFPLSWISFPAVSMRRDPELQAMTSISTAPPAGQQALLYEHVRPFDVADGDMRIFAPISYPRVRNVQLVPVVHSEALTLAHWFPICWLMRDGQATLVALRTLRCDGSGQPAGSPEQMASLPLALRAYPFVVGGLVDDAEQFFDAAIADAPSDIGAPIMTPAGKAGPGAQMKLQARAAFDQALPASQAMTDFLVANELLEPWPLDFDIDGEQVKVRDLFVLKASALASEPMHRFIADFGSIAATFLGAHRISLYRAGILVQSAKRSTAPAALVQ